MGALVVALYHFDPAAEADRVIVFGTHELPRIAVDEPVLGRFLLPAAADDLAEEAIVVADAVAVRGDGQRRHAVHETGGEATEAAIAERGVRLDSAQLRKLDAKLIERFAHWLSDAEIGQGVEQQAADQELEREVIDALAPIGVDGVQGFEPAPNDDVAGGERDRQKPVARGGELRNLADGVSQFRQHRGLEFRRGIGTHLGRFRRGFVGGDKLVHETSPPQFWGGLRPPTRWNVKHGALGGTISHRGPAGPWPGRPVTDSGSSPGRSRSAVSPREFALEGR